MPFLFPIVLIKFNLVNSSNVWVSLDCKDNEVLHKSGGAIPVKHGLRVVVMRPGNGRSFHIWLINNSDIAMLVTWF